jgi:hypothetical protein
LQSQWQYGPNSDLFARDETKTIMSIERQSKLCSGPPIVPADPATERDQLIAANQAFAAALKKALQSGAETGAGVLAIISPKRGDGIQVCERNVQLRRASIGDARGVPLPPIGN